MGIFKHRRTVFSNQWSRIDSSTVAPQVSLPGSDTFRFKELKQGETASHDFIIKNSGTSDLEISLIDQSENIDVILPDGKVILPGRTFPVTVKLRDTNLSGEFEGFAVIGTNDPSVERKQLRFLISGTISETGKTDPRSIRLYESNLATQRVAIYLGWIELYSWMQLVDWSRILPSCDPSPTKKMPAKAVLARIQRLIE